MSKVIFITGSCPRLGKRVAHRLAAGGYRVIVGLPDPTGADSAIARDLRDFSHVEVLPLNLADEWSATGAFAHVLEEYGAIDVLINHTGLAEAPHALDAPDVAQLRAVEQNVSSVLRAYQAVLPAMRVAGRGLVINIASGGPRSMTIPQRAAKIAIDVLTESLEEEMLAHGIETVLLRSGTSPVETVADEVLDLVRSRKGTRRSRICLESSINDSFRARAAV